ncbi:hypothetical protein MMC31_004450 [Peltigera leucophlebia]|nr:hypothetical protein [Peltigera leucophlebia]
MAPLPPPSGASLARPFQVGSNMRQATASPTIATMTAPYCQYHQQRSVDRHAGAQTSLPPAIPTANNAPPALPKNLANNPAFTTMQGDHGQASWMQSGVNGHITGFSNANDQEWHSDSGSDFYPVEMDLSIDVPEPVAPAPKPTRKSKTWSSSRQKLLNHSTKPGGGWPPINLKGVIPQKLANRLKDKFRAEIVAGCRSQHFEECRRDTKAVVDIELERMAKEHAENLENYKTKAEKTIREARGEHVNELKTIRMLEQANKAIESEAEIKDKRIRDLEAELQKSLAIEGDLKKRNVTAEMAVQKAQAESEDKAKQVRDLEMAKEAALENAAKKITDLQAENAALKEQIDDVKEDLKTSNEKVEDLETLIVTRPSPTEANHQAKSIRNLTSSVDQLTSIVAEQAKSLANINSTMLDFKKVNETLVKELASQRSEAEDKTAGLLEMFYAERQKREDLEKQIEIIAADDLKLTAATAPAEAVPPTEPSTTIIIQNDTPLSQSSSLVIPTVRSSHTTMSLRSIFDNLILLAYYFLFGNRFLNFGLLSMVILPGTHFFLSAFFDNFYTDLATEGDNVADTDTDKDIAWIPGGWRWWEDD